MKAKPSLTMLNRRMSAKRDKVTLSGCYPDCIYELYMGRERMQVIKIKRNHNIRLKAIKQTSATLFLRSLTHSFTTTFIHTTC